MSTELESHKLSFNNIFKDNKNIKLQLIGNYNILVSTWSQNFNTSRMEWKINGLVDFKHNIYIFSQGDPGKFDNWSIHEDIPLGNIFDKIVPDFRKNLENVLPEEKKYLVNKLYNTMHRCTETMFAIKEIIAWSIILNLEKEQQNYIFNNIKSINKFSYPYRLSYQDYITTYLENIINFLQSSPIPKEMKQYGREASAYGNLSFSNINPDIAKMKINNPEELLKQFISRQKLEIIQYNKLAFNIWEWIYQHDFTVMEISSFDENWGGCIIKSPINYNISVITLLIINICKFSNIRALDSWKFNPYSTNIHEINAFLKDKSIMDYIIEKHDLEKTLDYKKRTIIKGKNWLGNICNETSFIYFNQNYY